MPIGYLLPNFFAPQSIPSLSTMIFARCRHFIIDSLLGTNHNVMIVSYYLFYLPCHFNFRKINTFVPISGFYQLSFGSIRILG